MHLNKIKFNPLFAAHEWLSRNCWLTFFCHKKNTWRLTPTQPVPSGPDSTFISWDNVGTFSRIPASVCLMKQIERESTQWGDRHVKQAMWARWGWWPFPRPQTAPLQKLSRVGRAVLLPQPRAEWPVQAWCGVWGRAWAAGVWGPISLETWAGSKTGSLLE